MFVAEDKTLEDITAEDEWGLFPRMHAGRLSLFFWSRRTDGGILGCAVDDEALRRALLAALPGLHTAVRLLTLLDEMGVPLTTLPDDTELDLRRPFVAREVGPLLPRWEVAAYLSDPHIVASRAGVVKTAIGALVLLLFVSMATGGFLVLRSLRSEMTLARQRTTFVTNVSHELKTPLTSIRLYAEMLKNYEGTSREKRRRYLATMVAECERLTRLINNVLDFSKTERTERRYSTGPVDVTGLCRELVESQRTRLEQAGFRVRFRGAADDTTEPQRSDGADGSDGPLVVETDDQAVIQAALNLLSNAEKYSGDNREIDVSVYRRDDGPQSRPHAVIDIMDRGIGVPPSDRQRIFKQFYRVGDDLTAAVTGTGLGLTIARRQVRDQGGDIECLDRPGGGTIFRIRLPLPEQRES